MYISRKFTKEGAIVGEQDNKTPIMSASEAESVGISEIVNGIVDVNDKNGDDYHVDNQFINDLDATIRLKTYLVGRGVSLESEDIKTIAKMEMKYADMINLYHKQNGRQ